MNSPKQSLFTENSNMTLNLETDLNKTVSLKCFHIIFHQKRFKERSTTDIESWIQAIVSPLFSVNTELYLAWIVWAESDHNVHFEYYISLGRRHLFVHCSLLPLEQYTFQFLLSINLSKKFYFNSGLNFIPLWETIQPCLNTDFLESHVYINVCNLALLLNVFCITVFECF